MIKTKYLMVVIVFLVLISILLIGIYKKPVIGEYIEKESIPDIFPDYTSTVLPPNIAPLNFIIKENGEKYYVKIYSDHSREIKILSKNRKIVIPKRKWRNLLNNNRGKSIFIDIYIKNQAGKWEKFKTIINTIAGDEMDSYVAFRLINPAYILWEKMGIYQRDIESYSMKPILLNRTTEKNCMNCHTFCSNNPDKMILHLRSKPSGTILYNNGILQMLNTGTQFTMSSCVYPSWHPHGDIIAFSVNKIKQKFHSAGNKSQTVIDRASDIVLYDINKNMLTTSPKVSTGRLENLPNWSPDGKYLYFISGPKYYENVPDTLIRYDLMRISYDINTNKWGKVDTVLLSEETGKSITFPEVSPDGKYLLFCMTDYGYFSIYSPASDLYLMDLKSFEYKKLDINSDHVESFHSWSSNSRWFLFISKRIDGFNSRIYFSHIDEEGNVYKPVLLPQRDPEFYSTFIYNFNRPVFIKEKVRLSSKELTRAAFGTIQNVKFDPEVDIDALSGVTRIKKENQ
jgi:Tol biopolymer transport system component